MILYGIEDVLLDSPYWALTLELGVTLIDKKKQEDEEEEARGDEEEEECGAIIASRCIKEWSAVGRRLHD